MLKIPYNRPKKAPRRPLFQEIGKMKNKNEPNSSLKCNFVLVTLGGIVANGLATKRSLIMQFGGCGGCGGVGVTKMGKSDHLQGNNPKLLKSQL